MLNFKNKSIGYYLAAAAAVLSIIVAIIFFCTFNLPDDSGGTWMGNAAAGMAPETIGIFLIGGFLVELVVLFVPQYRFVQLVAILLYGLALYKDVKIIPDFIAGIANGVEYNHGNTPINMFFFAALLVIEILAIVSCFLGFFKDEKDAENKFGFDTKDTKNIVKVSVSGVVVVAAVLASSLIAASRTETKAVVTEEEVDPLSDEVKQAAEDYEYDFDPTTVLIKQKDASEYDFNDATLKGLSAGLNNRGDDMHLVYYFEGSYTEGWQGDYTPKYAAIYLWEDGLFVGKSNDDVFRGYWYNSSADERGVDPETGEDIINCVDMVSDSDRWKSIITSEVKGSGFYSRQAYIYMSPYSGGQRSTVVSGYYYYPEVALFIDNGTSPTTYHVGDKFNRGSWVAKRVLKNLKYSAVFKASEVKWTDEEGMLDEDGCFQDAGEYTVTAKWNGLEATKTVKVI